MSTEHKEGVRLLNRLFGAYETLREREGWPKPEELLGVNPRRIDTKARMDDNSAMVLLKDGYSGQEYGLYTNDVPVGKAIEAAQFIANCDGVSVKNFEIVSTIPNGPSVSINPTTRLGAEYAPEIPRLMDEIRTSAAQQTGHDAGYGFASFHQGDAPEKVGGIKIEFNNGAKILWHGYRRESAALRGPDKGFVVEVTGSQQFKDLRDSVNAQAEALGVTAGKGGDKSPG
ncbi:MAG: hypothetical protein MRY32_07000 [Rickettsiales bacterium]|nr:hypothetical protein [Rickettsiales bacterium]